MIRVVLDVNVLVAAVVSRGVCSAIVDAWLDGRFELVASPTLLSELDDVLGRAKFRRFVTAGERRLLVQLIRERGVVAEDTKPERIARDPSDDYLIALARSTGASVIVSGDEDLLVLKIDPPVMSPRLFVDALA